MQVLNNGITKLFDLLLAPVAAWPAVAMTVVAIVSAVWALLLFKAVTPQAKLTQVRDRLFGHIYEMGLYQEHLRVVARIQWDLARANLRYLSLTLPALFVLLVPMVLTLAQLDGRFAHRPLQVGEETVFTATLTPDRARDMDRVAVQTTPGLRVVAGPVQDRVAGAVAWRVKVVGDGDQEIVVSAGGRELVRRAVPVGNTLAAVGEKSEPDWLHEILFPGAPVLARGGAVAAMSLSLPARQVSYLGLKLDWLVAFMIISLLVGLAIKDVLRVSI